MKLGATDMTNETAAALLEAGRAAIRGGDVAFDLAAVKQVDSAAVALLLAWQREAQAANAPHRPHQCPACADQSGVAVRRRWPARLPAPPPHLGRLP
jgi:hypothetical protein